MDLLSMMSPMPSVDTLPRPQSMMGSSVSDSESGFVEVLDLVKDLEVSQDSEQTESELENGLKEQGWVPERLGQSDALGVDTLWIQQKLGQSGLNPTESLVDNVTRSSVSISAGDSRPEGSQAAWLMNVQMGSASVSTETKEPKVSREAAAQWSLALARDDIQSVEVSTPRPTGLDVKKMGPDAHPVESVMSSAGATKPETLALKLSDSRTPPSFEIFVSSPKENPKSDSRLETRKEKAASAVSGSSFVLSHLESLSGSSTSSVENAAQGKEAAMAAQDLRSSRMDPAQLRFVSDRIDALAVQGGGELRVVLNPEHLGSVELRVSKVQDRLGQEQQLRVEIRSDRPDVVQALENGKADLLANVGRNQSLRVDLQVMGSPVAERMGSRLTDRSEAFGATVASQAKPASLSSDSWFDLRKSDSAKDLNVGESSGQREALAKVLEGVTPALETGADSHHGDLLRDPTQDFIVRSEDSRGQSGEWERERRRDQARDQWAQNSGFRESA